MPTPRTPLRPPPGQTSLAARLAAPDQVDQVGGTLKCQVCGSANLEELCHEPPHPRFLCLDCNSGLNSDGHAMPAPDQADQVGGTHSYLWRQVFITDPVGQWLCASGHSCGWSLKRSDQASLNRVQRRRS